VHTLLDEIATQTLYLAALYTQTYDVAYARNITGAEGKTEIWESDPTGNVMATPDKRWLRQDLHNAVEMAKDAQSALRASKTMITKAMERAHGAFTYGEAVRMARGERDGSFPRTMTKDELARLEETQRKRQDRGEP
jgi:glutamate 5-kinase